MHMHFREYEGAEVKGPVSILAFGLWSMWSGTPQTVL